MVIIIIKDKALSDTFIKDIVIEALLIKRQRTRRHAYSLLV